MAPNLVCFQGSDIPQRLSAVFCSSDTSCGFERSPPSGLAVSMTRATLGAGVTGVFPAGGSRATDADLASRAYE